LQNNGVSEDQLQAVISSGPEALLTLTERVQAAVEANNGRPLGQSDAATLIRMPEGFSAVDMTMDQFIRQTYGLAAPAREEAPAEDLTFLQRISGMGEMASAEERLSRTPFAEGMTILDVNRAAQSAEYQSLIPGTFVTFATDSRYDVTEEGVDFLRDFTNQVDMLVESQDYRELSTQLPGGISREDAQEMQRQMRIEVADPLIRGYARRDPEGFMAAHEAQIRLRLGEAYVQQLREDLGLDAPEPEAPEVMTETPTLKTPALPDMESITLAPRAEDTDVDSNRDAEGLVEPDANTRVLNPETQQPVTYQEWQDMSRTERRRLGLPESTLGGMDYFNRFGVLFGINDPETGERLSERETLQEGNAQGSAGRRITRDQNIVQRRLIDLGVGEQSIQVLNSNGGAMQSYAIEKGARTSLEVSAAIEEYAAREGIELPDDLSFIVRAILTSMPQQ
jgi:hypothetical protein